MESRIARLEEVEEPRKEWVLKFDIAAAPRSSSVVASLDAATARLGDFVLGPVSLQVTAGVMVRRGRMPPRSASAARLGA